MTEAELAQTIIAACTHIDGILVSLRTENAFSKPDYDYLIALLQNYQVVLGESRMMDRQVAGCLHELELQLLIQVERWEDAPSITPAKQQLDFVFNEVSDFNASMFWK